MFLPLPLTNVFLHALNSVVKEQVRLKVLLTPWGEKVDFPLLEIMVRLSASRLHNKSVLSSWRNPDTRSIYLSPIGAMKAPALSLPFAITNFV